MKILHVENAVDPATRICVLECAPEDPTQVQDVVGRIVRLGPGLVGKIERVGDWDDRHGGRRVVVRIADDPVTSMEKTSAEVILGSVPTTSAQDAAARVAICKHGHPMFYALLAEMAELHDRKNHDYAGGVDPLANFKASARMGIDPALAVLIRMMDKWSRLEAFVRQGNFAVKDESVEDTLMDNAVYSLIDIVLRREQKARGNN